MAESIDQIIAGGAGASSRADFSGLSNIAKSYWQGRDEFAKNDLRDAFKGGVPLTPDGQPDVPAMARAFFEKGAPEQGFAASKLGLEQQKLKYGLDAAANDFPNAASPAPQPQAPIVSPVSANRGASVQVAPALAKGGAAPQGQAAAPQGRAQGPQGDQPGSIVGMVSAAGVPDELAGPIIQQVSAAVRSDPNAAINPQIAPRVQQIVAEAVKRSAAANQPQPPQSVPKPAAPSDPTLGGLVPAGRTPQQQLQLLSRRVASGLLAPEVAKVYETNIKGIQDALQPTPDMKNAAASGKSLEDYQNRGDEQTAQRDVMTKSLLPRVDASQEKANAARDDINSIHLAREQLDSSKGVFSGALADKKLALAKVYSMLGGDNSKVANTEAYGAAIGQRVASMVKAFGSGTAISDGDRRFAAAMAGGQVTLDEASMRRILDIGERASRGKIDLHNKFVDQIVGSNEALKPARDSFVVAAPGQYQKPGGAPAAIKDGMTAVNPKTNERIILQNGKWVPHT